MYIVTATLWVRVSDIGQCMYAVVNTENTISEPLSLRLLRTERRRIDSVAKQKSYKTWWRQLFLENRDDKVELHSMQRRSWPLEQSLRAILSEPPNKTREIKIFSRFQKEGCDFPNLMTKKPLPTKVPMGESLLGWYCLVCLNWT